MSKDSNFEQIIINCEANIKVKYQTKEQNQQTEKDVNIADLGGASGSSAHPRSKSILAKTRKQVLH